MQAAGRKKTAAGVERATLKRKLTKLKELYVNDLIDMEEYKKDYETYSAALLKLDEAQIEEKKVDLSGVRQIVSKGFLEIYDTLTREEKRTLWKSVLKEIRIDNDQNITGISFFSLWLY